MHDINIIYVSMKLSPHQAHAFILIPCYANNIDNGRYIFVLGVCLTKKENVDSKTNNRIWIKNWEKSEFMVKHLFKKYFKNE